jgi:hypothetical protein
MFQRLKIAVTLGDPIAGHRIDLQTEVEIIGVD